MFLNHSLYKHSQRPITTEFHAFSKNKNTEKQNTFKGCEENFLSVWNQARHTEKHREHALKNSCGLMDEAMPSLIHRNVEVIEWSKPYGWTLKIDRRFFTALLTAFILFMKIRGVSGLSTCFSQQASASNSTVDRLCKNGLGADKMALEHAEVTYDELLDKIYQNGPLIQSFNLKDRIIYDCSNQSEALVNKWGDINCHYTNRVLSNYLPDCNEKLSQDSICSPHANLNKTGPCENIERTLYKSHQAYKDLIFTTMMKICEIYSNNQSLGFDVKEQFKSDFKIEACNKFKDIQEKSLAIREICQIHENDPLYTQLIIGIILIALGSAGAGLASGYFLTTISHKLALMKNRARRNVYEVIE